MTRPVVSTGRLLRRGTQFVFHGEPTVKITPKKGELTLTGFPPEIITPVYLTPGVGALTVAGWLA